MAPVLNDNEVLKRINKATKMKFGREYFTELGAIVVDLTKADYTFLTKIDNEHNIAHPIVSFREDKLIPNIDYSLITTPCLTVRDTCVGFYPENVQNIFPNDHFLANLEIEGYIGASVVPEGDEVPVGIVTCLYKDKTEFAKHYLDVVELIASIAKTRIEREILLFEKQLVIKLKDDAQKELKYTKTLLKEIDHRLKNNLHIISGTLKLQALESKDPYVESQLEKAGERVRSMAKIHEKIYDFSKLDDLSLQDYFEDLLTEIILTNKNKDTIKVDVFADEVLLRPDPLSSVAMIVNELATNSIKHAFDGIEVPILKLKIIENGEDIVITFSDNGRGNNKNENKKGLGKQLIEIIVEQLKGNFKVRNGNGVTYTFTFPKKYILLESIND